MANLKNINFMSQERFENLEEYNEDELYAVVSVEKATMPDYTAGVSFSSGATVAYDGWIVFNSAGGGGFQSPTVTVDGVSIYSATNLDGSKWCGILPVRAGSVVSYGAMSAVKIYPNK